MSNKLAAALHGSGPCCAKCKTPFGVCATKWTCDHHRESAQAQAAADSWQDIQAQSEARSKRLSDAESKRMNEWKAWR